MSYTELISHMNEMECDALQKLLAERKEQLYELRQNEKLKAFKERHKSDNDEYNRILESLNNNIDVLKFTIHGNVYSMSFRSQTIIGKPTNWFVVVSGNNCNCSVGAIDVSYGTRETVVPDDQLVIDFARFLLSKRQ